MMEAREPRHMPAGEESVREALEDAHRQIEKLQRRIVVEEALERVRVRTMAMQRSDELAETASVVFRQLKALGVASEKDRFAFNIFDEANNEHKLWLTQPGGEVISRSFTVPRYEKFEAQYQTWRATPPAERKEQVFIYEFSGRALVDYLTFYAKYTNLADDETIKRLHESPAAAGSRVLHYAHFAQGALMIIGPDRLQAVAIKILKRFARVFEQTYSRFLDLKKAEDQVHAAERQAAIDRLRAEIASMRTSEDLQRITPLIWRELKRLGVPFFRCGVFTMDENTRSVQIFLSNPEGKALAALSLGFDEPFLVLAGVEHWKRGAIYTEEWDAARMQSWTDFLQERGLIQARSRYLEAETPPERLVLHLVPFTQGSLYVGSAEPLDADALESVQALADAFAVAYARYEDFQRLEAKNREVEAAMAELTAAQQQLTHSEKMAALGALTAGIAHQIKNPLNFVNNFAEVNEELILELRELLTNGEEVDYVLDDLEQNVKVIAQHGRRADSIVHSMIQHASGSSGEREPTDINALLDEYVGLAYHGKRAQQAGFTCKIEREFDQQIGQVSIVPQEIGRVFLNLLGNAFDAVYQHARQKSVRYTPTVTASTRQIDGQVEIRIADNGPGIPAGIKDKIFEPFFTTKPTGSATGLGLSLAYEIVAEGHGGALRVESTEGEGATFIVTLPAFKDSQC